MKRVQLVELLQLKSIAHPSRLISTSISGSTIKIAVSGYPWWRDAPTKEKDQFIRFLFERVTEGALEIGDFSTADFDWEEALEDFEISSLAEVDWAQPNSFSIFCSSPLEKPANLYSRLDDFLHEVRSYRRTEEFLNCGSGRFSEFIKITASDSYLIASGPECIREIVCGELDEQRVSYSVTQTSLPPNRHLLVRLGESYLLCANATAEFDE